MKLAECLLQEKPIRHALHRDRGIWFVPTIKKYCDKLHLSSHDLYNRHFLSPEDFVSDDWEVKPEPIKFEFEMSADHSVVNKIDECIPSLRGKRIKVTCEEIEE